MSDVNLSIVVPCFNSSKTIGKTLSTLTAFCDTNRSELGEEVEIIVVDDGSRDGTGDLVAHEFPYVSLVRLDQNQGKGAAVRTGMLAARAPYRFFVDADLPYDLAVLPTMLHYLDFKEFDLVIGARDTRDSAGLEKRTTLRRVASLFFTEFVSRIVVTGVRDTQCGFKGFRATAAEYLFRESQISRFAFDVEVLYLAYKNNLDIKRLPVHLVSEDASTVNVFRDGARMIRDILSLPIRYYTGQYRMLTTVNRSERTV